MSIDVIIITGFLVINLIAGLYHGIKIKNLQEYAIGTRNFSTRTLAATIIATWISGSFFSLCISETYKYGIWYLVAGLGQIVPLLTMGLLFGPRMRPFFGALSVAECMGNLYGKHVRIITALSSIAQAIGFTAMQLKVFSKIFDYFFGINSVTAMVLSSLIVVLYSAFGGIRSVIFTDIIQFITFGIFIPFFALFVWGLFGGFDHLAHAFATNPLLDFSQIVNIHNPNFVPFLFTLLYFVVPGLNSTMFQRMLMAKDVKQIASSFTKSALVYLILHLCASFVGILVLAHDSTLNAQNIVMFILDKYSFPGLKGLTLIGIIAMLMSTADSWINTGAVIVTHDLLNPLGIKMKDSLLFSRIFALFVGFIAIFLGLYSTTLFDLVMLQAKFYMPIVTIPLMLSLFGFRTEAKAVLIGMATGALTVPLWKMYVQPIFNADSVIPAMIANLIGLLLAHYILVKPKGRGGPGDWPNYPRQPQEQELVDNEKASNSGPEFEALPRQGGIVAYCNATAPRDNISYIYFSIATLSTLVPVFSINRGIYIQHAYIISILEALILAISTIFFVHKLWPEHLRRKYLPTFWYISVFIVLAFASSFLVLMNKFSQLSFMTFILNLTMIGIMVQWQAALVLIVTGIISALATYYAYIGIPEVIESYSTQLKILYLLITFNGGLLAFLQPKQSSYELTKAKNKHYTERINLQEEELSKLLELKMDFLRNLNHEVRTPITIISAAGQLLATQYDDLDEKAKRKAIEYLARGSRNLIYLMDDLLDLSKISSLVYNLNLKELDLSQLVKDRAEACKHLYAENKILDFVFNLEHPVMIMADEYYLKQALDHLILNAIKYTEEGAITLEVLQEDFDKIKFSIADTGIGVPEDELFKIFGPLLIDPKIRPRDGRGIGLALCKKIIELHGGHIWAMHNEPKGTIFTFILPSASSAVVRAEVVAADNSKEFKDSRQFEKIFDIFQINSDITKILDNAKETTRIEIAKVLLKLNKEVQLVADITQLSFESVYQLKAELDKV